VLNLSARLMGRTKPVRSVWVERFALVADRLVAEHGLPRLGNYRDPVREIFYIMLSAKTADAQYRTTERLLNRRFPTVADLANGQLADIRRCILSGGLAAKRSRTLRAAARQLLRLGPRPSAVLKRLPVEDAFTAIVALPGVGIKSAFCVLMYSLRADVFPVDVNCQRIAVRLGALAPGLSHQKAQAALAPLVPVGRSRELHVGMVVHGRTICTPLRPKCDRCSLRPLCAYAKKHPPKES